MSDIPETPEGTDSLDSNGFASQFDAMVGTVTTEADEVPEIDTPVTDTPETAADHITDFEPTGLVEAEPETESEVEPEPEPEPKVEPESAELEPPPVDESEEPNVIADLQNQIARLEAMIEQGQQAPAETEEPIALASEPIPVFDTSDPAAYMEILRDPAKVNEAFSNMMATFEQRLLQTLPKVLTSQIHSEIQTRQAVTDFYTTNADLSPHKAYVQKVAKQIQASNPDKSMSELLEKIATQSRKGLQLHKKATQIETGRIKKKGATVAPTRIPVFPPGTARTIEDTTADTPVNSISSMIKAVGGI